MAATAAVCHRLAEILFQLETAIGRAKKIVVSGGILQSPASLQILADSLGRNLDICAEQEASLRGAAIHALAQRGRKIAALKHQKRIRPDAAARARATLARARQNDLERACSQGR